MAEQTVTITVTGVNDGPTISDVADIGFVEDSDASAQDLIAGGTVNFDDIDASDLVDISTSLTSPAVWIPLSTTFQTMLPSTMLSGLLSTVPYIVMPG